MTMMATCLILTGALTVSMFQLLYECILPEASIQLNCIEPEVLIQLDYIAPKVSLQLHDFKSFSTTGISIHDLFFDQCGDAMLAPHQFMGSKAALGCFAISCPGWTSNHADVKVLPFDHGPSESLTAFASSLDCLPFDCGPNQLLTLCQANNSILCQVTEACSFCISDSIFYIPFG